MMRVIQTAVVGLMLCLPLQLAAPEIRPLSFTEAYRNRMMLKREQLEASIRRYDAILSSLVVEQTVPKQIIRKVKARVTACSPQDPQDLAYYAKNGYAGETYNIAADLKQFPIGTKMRVPGYMGGKWFEVDSAGGSVIRRSTRKGVYHIDVKFKTFYSAKKWGNKHMTIEYILPRDQ
jgi:3D (Asp-Asp-Asp) domain-containing protein